MPSERELYVPKLYFRAPIWRTIKQLTQLKPTRHVTMKELYKCLIEITNLKTLAGLLKGSELSRALFSEVVKLIKIHFTVPVSTATAERSFSQRRIQVLGGGGGGGGARMVGVAGGGVG